MTESRFVNHGALSGLLAGYSMQIDQAPANAARDPEARTWGRLAKVAEESGEVIAAYIGATGQNPRKGITHTMADVRAELLDVALTALMAYEHVTAYDGSCIEALADHALARLERHREQAAAVAS